MKARLEVKFSSGEGACTKEVKKTEYCAKRKGNEGRCPGL